MLVSCCWAISRSLGFSHFFVHPPMHDSALSPTSVLLTIAKPAKCRSSEFLLRMFCRSQVSDAIGSALPLRREPRTHQTVHCGARWTTSSVCGIPSVNRFRSLQHQSTCTFTTAHCSLLFSAAPHTMVLSIFDFNSAGGYCCESMFCDDYRTRGYQPGLIPRFAFVL